MSPCPTRGSADRRREEQTRRAEGHERVPYDVLAWWAGVSTRTGGRERGLVLPQLVVLRGAARL